MGIFKNYFSLLLIIVLLAVLFVSNPGTGKFMNWLVEDIRQEKGPLEGLLAGSVGKPLLRNMTERRGYIFFSLFEIKVPESSDNSLILGIAGRFIKLGSLIPEDMNPEDFIDRLSENN